MTNRNRSFFRSDHGQNDHGRFDHADHDHCRFDQDDHGRFEKNYRSRPVVPTANTNHHFTNGIFLEPAKNLIYNLKKNFQKTIFNSAKYLPKFISSIFFRNSFLSFYIPFFRKRI